MLDKHKTAQQMSSHKILHQNFLLKQIKICNIIKDLNQPILKRRKRRKLIQPFQLQFQQIQNINNEGARKKRQFSRIKDQKKVCKQGWNIFEENVNRQTHTSWLKARKDAKSLQNKMKSSNVWIKNGVNPKDKNSRIGQEKIKDLWHITKGTDAEVQVFRMQDLVADVKQSMVLGNAYKLCRNSSHPTTPRKQKLHSLVYLNQNAHRLPRQTYNELMQDNYLIP